MTDRRDGMGSEVPQEQRHPTLYLSDGDLVVSAALKSDKNTVQLFRIYKPFLACHSPIFKDMLAIGGGATNDIYDGVPRVHLPDDAEDVADFLRVLHNPAYVIRPAFELLVLTSVLPIKFSTLPFSRSDPDEVLKLMGIMKLAAKYEVAMLRTMIFRQLENQWPLTLSAWERRQHLRRDGKLRLAGCDVVDSYGGLDRRLSVTDWKNQPEPAFAIRFGMEFKCKSILGAAFYEIAYSSGVDDWDTAGSDWGVVRPVRWSMLHSEDILGIFKGRQSLEQQLRSDLRSLRDTIRAHCGYRNDIRKSRCMRSVDRLIADQMEDADTIGPLDLYRRMNDALCDCSWEMDPDPEPGEDLWCCPESYKMVRECLMEHAKAMWKSLPIMFDFDHLSQ